MILKAGNKTVELKYKTRSIVNLTNTLKGTSFEELFFKASSENNVEALSQIILEFAKDPDNGSRSFNNVDDVYNFLDDYMEDTGCTYQDIFANIAKSVNEAGFFNKKMSEEDLINKLETHFSIDMNELVTKTAEKAMLELATEEMKISKG